MKHRAIATSSDTRATTSVRTGNDHRHAFEDEVPGVSAAVTSPGRPRPLFRTGMSTLLLAAVLLPCIPCSAATHSAEKIFDGLFVGLDVGSQNYFGGAVVGDVDVLTRDTKTVNDVSLGYRKQLAGGRLLVGLRVNYGHTDGDLEHFDPAGRFDISYRNDSQLGFGAELGVVLGQRRSIALFLYGYETERDFDVTISTPFGSFEQSDEQGVFRFGLGAEFRLRRGLHLRGTVGTGRADFGNRFVNQDVDGRTDFGIGAVYQF